MPNAQSDDAEERTDSTRLRWCVGMFDGRDEDIRCRTTVILTTRAVHVCLSADGYHQHNMPIGTRAMREHAIVDGRWCTSYCCVACLDKWMDKEDMR